MLGSALLRFDEDALCLGPEARQHEPRHSTSTAEIDEPGRRLRRGARHRDRVTDVGEDVALTEEAEPPGLFEVWADLLGDGGHHAAGSGPAQHHPAARL